MRQKSQDLGLVRVLHEVSERGDKFCWVCEAGVITAAYAEPWAEGRWDMARAVDQVCIVSRSYLEGSDLNC